MTDAPFYYNRLAGPVYRLPSPDPGASDYDDLLKSDPDALRNEQEYWINQLPRYRGAQWEHDLPVSPWSPWKPGGEEHYTPRTPHYTPEELPFGSGQEMPPLRTNRSY